MSESFPPALVLTLEQGLQTLRLDSALAPPLLTYLELLERWNRVYNLTAVRDPQAMVSQHLLDALSVWPFVQGLACLADLGSGAGLPGIPLALATPRLQVTLVESNGKKARFLRQAVRSLELDNAHVAQARAEALPPATFDAMTARALSTLSGILAIGGHLLRPGGRLLALKGARPDDEIATLPPGWHVDAVHRLMVPGLHAERHLVVVCRNQPGDGKLIVVRSKASRSVTE